MTPFLLLDLEAPMSSFGGEVVDDRGVVRDYPAQSMITGLLGNALGIDRADSDALDSLQSRIVHAAALVRAGHRRRDYQTARLFENEIGWTTQGNPEGRAKSKSFSWDIQYEAARDERRKSLTHQRYRDYDMDTRTLVAVSLLPKESGPDIEKVACALRSPSRPLFIGRKACIPSRPVLRHTVEAVDILTAIALAMNDCGFNSARVQWSAESALRSTRERETESSDSSIPYTLTGRIELVICDERRHANGVHGGSRKVLQANMSLPSVDFKDDPLAIHSLSALMGNAL